jgi:hypothetical protein
MFRFLIALSIATFVGGSVLSQNFLNRFENSLGIYSTVGSQKDQAFWLMHNRHGLYDDASANGLTFLSTKISVRESRVWDFGAGVDLVARASQESDLYFHQAYLEGKFRFLNLSVGFKEASFGHTHANLSSGSLAMSSNARPIPRVSAYMPEFYAIPFTQGWVEFKAHFAHGWLSDQRYVKDSYIHDKSFFVQAGGKSGFNAYWGIVHLAIWGGNSPEFGKLPSSLSDFKQVIFAKEGGDDAPATEINALGFHTGIWDMGIRATWRDIKFHLYYQHLFTDGSGMKYRNKGDGLYGLAIENPFEIKYVRALLFEFLYTLHQSGYGLSDPSDSDWPDFCETQNCGYLYGGRDNYYNNGMYRSGLSFHGMSIGTPLFLTQHQLNKVNPSIETYSSQNFVSTRNKGYHLGVMGDLTELVSYKLFATQVQYFGTYDGLNQGAIWGFLDPATVKENYFFYPAQKQWYFMLETNWSISKIKGLSLSSTVALDKGDLFNGFGGMVGVVWHFAL